MKGKRVNGCRRGRGERVKCRNNTPAPYSTASPLVAGYEHMLAALRAHAPTHVPESIGPGAPHDIGPSHGRSSQIYYRRYAPRNHVPTVQRHNRARIVLHPRGLVRHARVPGDRTPCAHHTPEVSSRHMPPQCQRAFVTKRGVSTTMAGRLASKARARRHRAPCTGLGVPVAKTDESATSAAAGRIFLAAQRELSIKPVDEDPCQPTHAR